MNNFHPHEIQTALFADCLANSQAIFQLIDTVFPVDSCRHYEVLPLSLVAKDLTMGVLDPSNEESLKFINSIVNVFKYNLTLKLIDLQTHQIILASYPHSSPQQPTSARQDRDRNHTVIDHSLSSEAIPLNQAQRDRRNSIDSAPTIISIPDSTSSNHEAASGLEDLPPDLDFLKDLELTSDKPVTVKSDTGTADEILTEFRAPKNTDDNKATLISANPGEFLAQEVEIDPNEEAQIFALIAEVKGEVPEVIATRDFLPALQSQLSWQKLLEAAFQHHIHQIILTRHSDRGSIVANENGNLQSKIEQLPLPTFCSLIDEIKRMARIPQNTANHPKKVVLERIYEEERILLRLEFTAQSGTEIAVVNILRDRELQTYEQKQMDRISDHALQLAQQLEKALKKIQACFDSAEINNLAELQTIQSRINHQLRLLDKI